MNTYKFNTIYRYDFNSLNEDNSEYFKYSNKDKELIYLIQELFIDKEGLFVIGGNRGVGKTSLLEKAIQLTENRNIFFLRLPIINSSEDLYYLLLKEMDKTKDPNCFDKEKIKKYLDEFKTETVETYTKTASDLSTDENTTASSIFLKYLPLSLKKDTTHNNKKVNVDDKITTKTRREIIEEKKKNYINFFRECTKKNRIIVLIDELDKLKVDTVGDIIEKNKEFFLQTNILTFLICSKYDALFLEDRYSDYITDFLYCDNMSLNEFIIKSKEMEFSCDIESSVKLYYQTLGNHRELIKLFHLKQATNHVEEKAALLYYFINSTFYVGVEDKYRDIVLEFFKYFIEKLYLFNSMSLREVELVKNSFIEQRYKNLLNISILIDKCIEYIKQGIIASKEVYIKNFNYSESDALIVKLLNDINTKKICLFDNETKTFQGECTKGIISSIKNDISNLSMSDLFVSNYRSFLNRCSELFFSNIKENKRNTYYSRKRVNIKIDEKFCSVDDAIERLNYHATETKGIIIFHPFDRFGKDDNYKPLINGYIIIDNGFELKALSYTGYPGLTSHKRYELSRLIVEARNKNVTVIEIKNTSLLMEIWDGYFSEKNKDKEINDFIEENDFLKKWINLLADVNFYKETFNEELIEVIYCNDKDEEKIRI